ncbi:MAG: glycine cleavage system aminomethyltransferase GcvT [Myxococcales bacterium]|nr:glycine cleavage system aminomethyltransferase GcvT [Myxococcales bacterium]
MKTTPLHAEHVALGARMVPFAGWDMPVQYQGIKPEHQAVRTAAGLFDVSHMGEMILEGDGAGALVQRLITNDASKLVDGQALYTCACNAQGTILDDLIVYRLAPARWLVVCNASNRDKMVGHFRAAASEDGVSLRDASDDYALIALQGPKALGIAAESGDTGRALADLGSFHLAETKLFGVDVIAARTGYTGEDGVEIFCAAGDAVTLWRAIMEAGQKHGLLPAGLAARDTLRLEARLSLYGNDIDETTNPIEAGLGWTVKLKAGDFLGRDALLAIKAAGPSRTMVGFEMVGRGIARHGYPIHAHPYEEGAAPIGIVTSGSPSPTLGKNIGMGYVPVALREPGTPFVVDCRGRFTEAVVVKTPFYKRA